MNLQKVGEHAKVWCEAAVCGYAVVYGNAWVSGEAKIYGNAEVGGNAWIGGFAWVYENAEVRDNAKVKSFADYIVFREWWDSNRFFTWTRSNNQWRNPFGFYFTGEKLIKKAYEDSPKNGREYERVVKYVESMLEDE